MVSIDWNCFSKCSLLFAISIHTFSDFYWELLLFWLLVSAIHFDSALSDIYWMKLLWALLISSKCLYFSNHSFWRSNFYWIPIQHWMIL
jgi:hypothetical protein